MVHHLHMLLGAAALLLRPAHTVQVCPGTPANHSLPTQVTCELECCEHSYYGAGSKTVGTRALATAGDGASVFVCVCGRGRGHGSADTTFLK